MHVHLHSTWLVQMRPPSGTPRVSDVEATQNAPGQQNPFVHTAFAKIDAEAKASVEAMLATGEPSYRKGALRQPSDKWRTTSA